MEKKEDLKNEQNQVGLWVVRWNIQNKLSKQEARQFGSSEYIKH